MKDALIGCPGDPLGPECGQLLHLDADWCPRCERTFPSYLLRKLYEDSLSGSSNSELLFND